MKLFHVLINLAKGIKNSITHSDTNLQEAKEYTDTKTAVRPWNITFTTSGVNDVAVSNGIAVGNIIFNSLTVPVKTWTKIGQTTDLPSESYVLSHLFKGSDVTYVGALAVRANGSVEIYSLYALSGTAVYGMIAYTLGGVIRNILTALSGRRCYA